MAKQQLKILSWQGRWGKALQEHVSIPFSKAYDVDVIQIPHIGLRLPPSLKENIDNDNVADIDLVWCNTLAAHDAYDNSRVKPFEQEDFTDLAPRARTKINGVINAYSVPYVLAYHTEQTQAAESWNDLFHPNLYKKLACYPGGNGLFAIAQVLGGGQLKDIPNDMTPCWNFIQKLLPQLGEIDYSIGMERLFKNKKIHMAFRALPNVLEFSEQGIPVSWCIPKEGTCDTLDSFFIPKNVARKQAMLAQKYISYALSNEVQTRWCQALGVMPMNIHAKVPNIIKTHPRLPNTPKDTEGLLYVDDNISIKYQWQWEKTFCSFL